MQEKESTLNHANTYPNVERNMEFKEIKLEKCICGKDPKKLIIKTNHRGSRWLHIKGRDCCHNWWLEIDNKKYFNQGSPQLYRTASEQWNSKIQEFRKQATENYYQKETQKTHQTKINSFIEANINTILGFIISTLAWHYLVPIIFPHLAPHTGWGTAIWVTVFFTIISVIRNYFIRRLFTWLGK